MINVVNLQADTNYVNQNINPNAVATTTPDSFNPYVNLDSMTQTDNSLVFDLSFYPNHLAYRVMRM